MAGSYILYKKLHHNGLMTDLGLIPILTYDIYLSSVVCPRLLVDFFLTLRSGTAFSRHCALCQ